MNNFDKYIKTSYKASRLVTNTYSTSFSLATGLLKKEQRYAIYAIYGFVRLADEIVDTFHEFNKEVLLANFEDELKRSIELGISLNPILQSFQQVVKRYDIPYNYVDSFLSSMKSDLEKREYKTKVEADLYIYGSADVVGLMCLRVFCNGNQQLFDELKYPAMKLGSAFQKVNFLRDLKDDTETLGRNYFPNFNKHSFNEGMKQQIVRDIENDFTEAYKGIKRLPGNSRTAVFLAYLYYRNLLNKIAKTRPKAIIGKRIRISNFRKMLLLAKAQTLTKFNLL